MHRVITIPTPSFDSELVRLVIELDRLRWRSWPQPSHAGMFSQITAVFHLVESLESARIEGNRTTIDELVEATIAGERDATEQLREISNIEDAMAWIERVFHDDPAAVIDEAFLKELHRLVVKNLRPQEQGGEGDVKPGAFRSRSIAIRGASHKPPSPFELEASITHFIDFVNAESDIRYDALRIAIAHHRFEYIHPFGNGNGRVGRLLTYAMLVRAGFHVQDGRLLNPSAVFCRDRAQYMRALSAADSCEDSDVLAWCEFVLRAMHREFSKLDKLLNEETLRDTILLPTLELAERRARISSQERVVLQALVYQQVADAQLFRGFYPTKSASSISQIIARYKHRELIIPYPNINSRSYVVNLLGRELLHPLVSVLEQQGYVGQ